MIDKKVKDTWLKLVPQILAKTNYLEIKQKGITYKIKLERPNLEVNSKVNKSYR